MADPSRSRRPHTRSQSRGLSTGSGVDPDDPQPRPSSAHERPPSAFDSSFVEPSPPAPPETPFRPDGGLNTAPDTVRPAARPILTSRPTRRLGEAGSHHDNGADPSEVSLSSDVISDRQMQRLMMTFEMEKERRKALEEKRKALELELRIEEVRERRATSNHPQNADNNSPSPTTRSPTWDPDLGNKLGYNLYNPDSRVGKALSQFKEEVRNVTKPDALTGTSNSVTWKPEWAPFWDARNRWIYAFISNSLGANVRPRFVKYDEGRIAYTLWRAIEEEYSIPKTQLRREAVLEFTSLGGTQATNVHAFFDKFRAAIINLEMLDAMPPRAWVFDIFYSALPNIWRNYV
ncbi:hypothetical protein ACJ73_08379 [Blastomyces percursus]|uniref:Uncharacterized protein n=1 Tax=Blastomyces percursus TaxID=1658174 RepID=A0A1J9PV92_9EURO|nr:hypothetical protein ACJ73_08379 [Blastomyces percursus]